MFCVDHGILLEVNSFSRNTSLIIKLWKGLDGVKCVVEMKDLNSFSLQHLVLNEVLKIQGPIAASLHTMPDCLSPAMHGTLPIPNILMALCNLIISQNKPVSQGL